MRRNERPKRGREERSTGTIDLTGQGARSVTQIVPADRATASLLGTTSSDTRTETAGTGGATIPQPELGDAITQMMITTIKDM